MRKDGTKVKNPNGSLQIMCDLKPNRSEAEVYINSKIDVTNLSKYIGEYNKKTNLHLTYFQAFSAAIVKTFYNRPLLNRFVANRTFYDRNYISLGFVAKVKFEDYSKEILALIKFSENDTIKEISEKLDKQVKKIRSNKQDSTDNAVDALAKMPKLLRIPAVKVLKILDKHGHLPKSVTNGNLYYSTAIISDLGSIGCGAIYHNLANFGTSSCLITIGTINKEKVIKNEKEELRDICEFGITLDERIADGFYFTKSVKLLEYIIDNPKLLEDKVGAKIEIR